MVRDDGRSCKYLVALNNSRKSGELRKSGIMGNHAILVSYSMGKLRGLQHKGWISAVQSSQSRWTGLYKKCVQYNFKITSIYSETDQHIILEGVKGWQRFLVHVG